VASSCPDPCWPGGDGSVRCPVPCLACVRLPSHRDSLLSWPRSQALLRGRPRLSPTTFLAAEVRSPPLGLREQRWWTGLGGTGQQVPPSLERMAERRPLHPCASSRGLGPGQPGHSQPCRSPAVATAAFFCLQHTSTLGSVFGDPYYERQMAARQANALSHQVSGRTGHRPPGAHSGHSPEPGRAGQGHSHPKPPPTLGLAPFCPWTAEPKVPVWVA
jgi:hypothetical protein